MEERDYEDFTDPVAYSDDATFDPDLLNSIFGKEGDDCLRHFLTLNFFQYYHWN